MTKPGEAPNLHLGRNAVIGFFLMGGMIAIGSILLGVDPFVAVASAAFPALVAGPFVGGMITVATYHGPEDEPSAHG